MHQMRSGCAGARAQVLRQRVEVVRLAKERGQVGGQAVDELLPFGVARRAVRLLEPLQVVAERAVPGLAQAPRQPAVDHRLLAGVQADAGALRGSARAPRRSRRARTRTPARSAEAASVMASRSIVVNHALGRAASSAAKRGRHRPAAQPWARGVGARSKLPARQRAFGAAQQHHESRRRRRRPAAPARRRPLRRAARANAAHAPSAPACLPGRAVALAMHHAQATQAAALRFAQELGQALARGVAREAMQVEFRLYRPLAAPQLRAHVGRRCQRGGTTASRRCAAATRRRTHRTSSRAAPRARRARAAAAAAPAARRAARRGRVRPASCTVADAHSRTARARASRGGLLALAARCSAGVFALARARSRVAQRRELRLPTRASQQPPLSERQRRVAPDDEMVEHANVHQPQRRLQRLRQELVGTRRLGQAGRMVVREHDRCRAELAARA